MDKYNDLFWMCGLCYGIRYIIKAPVTQSFRFVLEDSRQDFCATCHLFQFLNISCADGLNCFFKI